MDHLDRRSRSTEPPRTGKISPMRTLRFYFDYISNNAFLAWVRLPELRERLDLRIEPVPVLFAGLLEANGQLGPAEVRPKARWMWRNCLRKAGLLGVRLRPPPHHPFNPLLPLRVSSLDLPDDAREALIDGLFRATWSEQRHVSDPEVVASVADAVGLDGTTLVAQAGDQAAKDRLRAQTDAAIEADVFGIPTFVVEDELFWGYDDIPYLENFLAGKDTIDPEEARHARMTREPNPSSMRRQFREQVPLSWRRDAERAKAGDEG